MWIRSGQVDKNMVRYLYTSDAIAAGKRAYQVRSKVDSNRGQAGHHYFRTNSSKKTARSTGRVGGLINMTTSLP